MVLNYPDTFVGVVTQPRSGFTPPLELIPEFLGQIIGLGFVLYLNNQVQGDNMIDE